MIPRQCEGGSHAELQAIMLAAAAGLRGSVAPLEDFETGYEEIVYTKNPSAFINGFWVFDLGAMTAITVRRSRRHLTPPARRQTDE